jgi:hypothetical protein
MTLNEREDYAQTMFAQHPELFSEARRKQILNGSIEIGMTPFEAKLAGGAFAYKVIADRSQWPEHSDPFKVMWAQSTLPDNSQIWMTFKNKTQFSGKSDCVFQVFFVHGKATKLEKLQG